MSSQATKPPRATTVVVAPGGQGFPACRSLKSVHRKDFSGSPRRQPNPPGNDGHCRPGGQGFPACRSSKFIHRRSFDGSPRRQPSLLSADGFRRRKTKPKRKPISFCRGDHPSPAWQSSHTCPRKTPHLSGRPPVARALTLKQLISPAFCAGHRIFDFFVIAFSRKALTSRRAYDTMTQN